MKKIKKLLKKLNNRGSSVIMVIVSLAFIAVIVGALLSAAGYAYRLKMVNKNAKDNFYYVEQAMQEIYAGVGAKTVEQMYDAYTSTIENMVYYDLAKNSYITLSNEEANTMFKKRFIENVKNDAYFNQSDDKIAESLSNFISNDTVTIDENVIHVDKQEDKILIKNVTLNRTTEYSNNAGSGTYTQTVSADIEICEPDFEVNFDSSGADYSNLFEYAMVADMGVEIEQQGQSTLKIIGNIYAASDYYNKSYNAPIADSDSNVNDTDGNVSKDRNFKYTYKDNDETGAEIDKSIEYNNGAVSSKTYDATETGLCNKFAIDANKEGLNKHLLYDGENVNSMNSGLFINNSNVSILANTLIVPGTIAVMNNSDLSVYNKADGKVTSAEVWADNIVLGGYGENKKKTTESSSTTTTNPNLLAPSAYFSADLFVRDDTELNAQGSSFTLKGGYYGYGDSTERDTRVFVPTVDKENFMLPELNEDGTIKKDDKGNIVYSTNRGHYNSSSIVINGQQSTIDLSSAKVIYLAGRSYIELSKDVKYNDMYVDKDGKLQDKESADSKSVVTETYEYKPTVKDDKGNITNFITDYKTGESLSIKTNQLAYIPIVLNGMPEAHTINNKSYFCVELHPDCAGVGFFEEFFPTSVFGKYVPVISQSINNRTYYYYDLDTAYNILKTVNNPDGNAVIAEYPTADKYSASFITAYTEEATSITSGLDLPLNDIVTNEDFTSGNVILSGNNDGAGSTIYSSGAITTRITTKLGTQFSMIMDDDTATLASDLLGYSNNVTTKTDDTVVAKAFKYSKSLSMEYNYIKWNLGHFDTSEVNEKNYVDKLFDNGWGEDMITPINRYLNINKIDSTKKISPSNFNLSSGYKIWVSDEDVTIGASDDDYSVDNNGAKTTSVKGIVITKGDVVFNEKVTRFEGLIISGGKIFIRGKLESMTSSPEICRSIIRECMVVNDETSRYILNLFKQYMVTDDGTCPVCGKVLETDTSTGKKKCPDATCTYNSVSNELLVDVDNIDYTDVCSVNNWNKTVE